MLLGFVRYRKKRQDLLVLTEDLKFEYSMKTVIAVRPGPQIREKHFHIHNNGSVVMQNH